MPQYNPYWLRIADPVLSCIGRGIREAAKWEDARRYGMVYYGVYKMWWDGKVYYCIGWYGIVVTLWYDMVCIIRYCI